MLLTVSSMYCVYIQARLSSLSQYIQARLSSLSQCDKLDKLA